MIIFFTQRSRFLMCLAVILISLVVTNRLSAKDPPASSKKSRSLLAYVFDERFSVLRTQPGAEAAFLRRLRVGHRVFIPTNGAETAHPKYRKVVVSRNVVGWMPAAALAAPGIAGDDEKLFRYALAQPDEKALIALRILTAHFDRSPLRARALLRLGQLADAVSARLSNRANRTLDKEELQLPDGIDEEDLFANYRGLDRFASFGVRFIYLRKSDRFLYCGEAFREILRRYPESQEAVPARERLVETNKLTQKEKEN